MGSAASISGELSNEDIGIREKLKAELFQSDEGLSSARLSTAFRKYDRDHDDILSNEEFRMVLSELGCDLDQQQVALIIPRILGDDKENIILGEIEKASSHSGVHLDNFVEFFGRELANPSTKQPATKSTHANNGFYSKQCQGMAYQDGVLECHLDPTAETEASVVIQQRTRGWLSKRNYCAVTIQAQARGQMVRNATRSSSSTEAKGQAVPCNFYSKGDTKEASDTQPSDDFGQEHKARNKNPLVSQSLNDQGWTQQSRQSKQHQRAHDILQQYFDQGGSVNAMLKVLANMMEGDTDMVIQETQLRKSRSRRTQGSGHNDDMSTDGNANTRKMKPDREDEAEGVSGRRDKQERHRERSKRKGRRKKEHGLNTSNSNDNSSHDASNDEKGRSRSRSRSPDKNSRRSPKQGSPKEQTENNRSTGINPCEDDALGSLLGIQAEEKSSAQIRYQERAKTTAIATAARLACVAAHAANAVLETLPTFELLSGAESNSPDAQNISGPDGREVVRTEGDDEAYGYSDDEFEVVKSVRFSNHVQVEYMPPYIYEERKQLFFQSEDYTRFCQEGEEERLKQQQAENLRALQEKMQNVPASTGEESEYDF